MKITIRVEQLTFLLISIAWCTQEAQGYVAAKTAELPVKRENPSDICFVQYSESIESASNAFEANHNECTQIYNNNQELISADEAEQRQQLKTGTAQLCNNFATCNALNTELEFLHCYVDMGPINDELMTAIQVNSSRAAISLNESFANAEKLYKLCTMDAEDNYKKSSSQAFADLHTCLSIALST